MWKMGQSDLLKTAASVAGKVYFPPIPLLIGATNDEEPD
tara:strand:- start:167651 stop:167767 length:117 start_codon:yes stop_codon:yes gene_type:complete